MQNTVSKPRNSWMMLSSDREEFINTPGSLNKLQEIINENNINIDTVEIMKSLPTYTRYMTVNQRATFTAYFWRQMSIHSIRCECGFKSINDVERPLKSAIQKYIKMLKADYGVK